MGLRTSHLFFLNLQLEQTIFRFLVSGTVPDVGNILKLGEVVSSEANDC